MVDGGTLQERKRGNKDERTNLRTGNQHREGILPHVPRLEKNLCGCHGHCAACGGGEFYTEKD